MKTLWTCCLHILLAWMCTHANAQGSRYVGPIDEKDWSRGPSCLAPSKSLAGAFDDVPCSDADEKSFLMGSIVPNAIMHKKFEQIEALYARWHANDARYPDGLSKEAWLCEAVRFAWQHVSPAEDKAQERISRWQQAHRSSFMSRFAEAAYWHAAAWDARGSGYARTVSKEQFQLFKQRLNQSLNLMEQMRPEAAQHPCWYSLKIKAMIDADVSLQQIEAIHREGVNKFPQHHQIDFAMARAYTPLWGGSLKSHAQFVDQTVARTRSFEGDGYYARLHWIVDNDNDIPFESESSHQPNWPKLKKAYLDLLDKYPDSEINKNRFAAVACRTHDSKLYQRLVASIKVKHNQELSPGQWEACDIKHGVKTGGPFQAAKPAATQELPQKD